MNLDAAIIASAVEIAVRPARDDEALNTPVVACRQVTGWIKHRDPVYAIYVHSRMNKPVSPVLAYNLNDWVPFDPLEVVDAIARLDPDYPIDKLRQAIDTRLKDHYAVKAPSMLRALLAGCWQAWTEREAQ